MKVYHLAIIAAGVVILSAVGTCLLSYKLGVIQTTERVNRVLNQQANSKLKDSTFRAMCREFPEDVE